MFKRIIYDEWTTIVPLISFWFTFGVFLTISLRALFMKKDKIQHMGHLPLDEDESRTTQSSQS